MGVDLTEPAIDSGNARNPVASVAVLRLQPELMRVISHSQQRCKDLWSTQKEDFVNHSLRIRYAQQARRKEMIWTTRNETLLENLLKWRDRVANQLECLPAFVAPMDILLPIALQQPTSDEALRRTGLPLPDILEHDVEHRRTILNLIQDFLEAHGTYPDESLVLRYSEIGTGRRGKPKRFPWALVAIVVGAAGVLVAARHTRRF